MCSDAHGTFLCIADFSMSHEQMVIEGYAFAIEPPCKFPCCNMPVSGNLSRLPWSRRPFPSHLRGFPAFRVCKQLLAPSSSLRFVRVRRHLRFSLLFFARCLNVGSRTFSTLPKHYQCFPQKMYIHFACVRSTLVKRTADGLRLDCSGAIPNVLEN